MDPLRRAALLWAIDDQPAAELPEVATDLLVRGVDSPALRELAGASPDDFWAVKALFEQTLRELGIDEPADEQAALWSLAREAAREIVQGEREPGEGAQWIWRHLSDRAVPEGDLRIFIGWGSEWEDHPDDRARIDAGVMTAAAELLARAEPRRWLQLRARQGRSPLADSGTQEEVAPGDLPIGSDLTADLSRWSSSYEHNFAGVAGASGFESEAAARQFVEVGRHLVDRLRRELGDSWWVEYRPEPVGPPGLRLRAQRRTVAQRLRAWCRAPG